MRVTRKSRNHEKSVTSPDPASQGQTARARSGRVDRSGSHAEKEGKAAVELVDLPQHGARSPLQRRSGERNDAMIASPIVFTIAPSWERITLLRLTRLPVSTLSKISGGGSSGGSLKPNTREGTCMAFVSCTRSWPARRAGPSTSRASRRRTSSTGSSVPPGLLSNARNKPASFSKSPMTSHPSWQSKSTDVVWPGAMVWKKLRKEGQTSTNRVPSG